METILLAINDSSDMLCFDLYLIKIFVKSTKAKRYTDVVFKLTLYCHGWKKQFFLVSDICINFLSFIFKNMLCNNNLARCRKFIFISPLTHV